MLNRELKNDVKTAIPMDMLNSQELIIATCQRVHMMLLQVCVWSKNNNSNIAKLINFRKGESIVFLPNRLQIM